MPPSQFSDEVVGGHLPSCIPEPAVFSFAEYRVLQTFVVELVTFV